jgi:manganese-dependent inorganic pyrophosphatase
MRSLILVTPKRDPDLDGAACAIAYAELLERTGFDAIALVDGEPDAEVRYSLNEVGWAPPSTPAPPGEGCEVVLVDASDVLGLPSVVDPSRVVEVIDHRQHHDAARLFPRARIQIEPVGAAATLVAERWRAMKMEPSQMTALLLQAAIQSNTQRLRGSVTTHRDVEAAAWLRGIAALPDGFIEGQFAARAKEILADVEEALARETKRFDHPDGPFLIAQLELPGATNLVEVIAAANFTRRERIMVNLVDADTAKSFLLIWDEPTRQWAADRLGMTFVGLGLESHPAILRKQIVARLLGLLP